MKKVEITETLVHDLKRLIDSKQLLFIDRWTREIIEITHISAFQEGINLIGEKKIK